MSSIKVKETRASKLRAARNYSTRSSSSSKSTIKRSAVNTKKSVSSSSDKKKWVCGVCSESLSKENSVGCDGECKKWFHADCAGVDNQQFRVLLEDGDSVWKCSSCTDKDPSPSDSQGIGTTIIGSVENTPEAPCFRWKILAGATESVDTPQVVNLCGLCRELNTVC